MRKFITFIIGVILMVTFTSCSTHRSTISNEERYYQRENNRYYIDRIKAPSRAWERQIRR